MRRREPDSWRRASDVINLSNGIIGQAGVGQSDFVWAARLLPRVRQAFRAIWRTDDLLVSFDGANLFLPWHRSKKATVQEKTRGGWFHVDQVGAVPVVANWPP